MDPGNKLRAPYARWSDSDLFVIQSTLDDALVCIGCSLISPEGTRDNDYKTWNRQEMMEHLQEHVDKGHRVPSDAIQRLRWESIREGEAIPLKGNKAPLLYDPDAED